MTACRILTSLALSAAVLASSCVSHAHRDAHSPQACARRLHVAYSVEDGATERLTAFRRCVNPQPPSEASP